MEINQNYTHILNIDIDNKICDNEKNKIISFIYNTIHDKVISKYILNTNIPIKWIVVNNSNLLTYYTDVKGMLGDRAVYLHTEILLNHIRNKLDIDNFNFNVTKPLMQQICLL